MFQTGEHDCAESEWNREDSSLCPHHAESGGCQSGLHTGRWPLAEVPACPCLSVCLSLGHCVSVRVCLLVTICIALSVFLPVCLTIHLHLSAHVCLLITVTVIPCMSFCLCVLPSVCTCQPLSVCLSVSAAQCMAVSVIPCLPACPWLTGSFMQPPPVQVLLLSYMVGPSFETMNLKINQKMVFKICRMFFAQMFIWNMELYEKVSKRVIFKEGWSFFWGNCIITILLSLFNFAVQCLCLAPTYELAVQIGEVIEKMSKYMTGLRMRYATRGERGESAAEQRECRLLRVTIFWMANKKVVIWDMQCCLWKKRWCNVVQLHSLECKLLWITNHDQNALRAVKKFCLKNQSCMDVPIN